MKVFFAFILLSLSLLPVFAQNEQSPMVEKTFDYKDWTYKNIRTEESTNLRELTKGKKLVMVVYFAPWCPNWKYDAPLVQKLYDNYNGRGLEVIAVGEYDPVASMKTHLEEFKITFPAVYESELRTSRETTTHAIQRRETGDTRKWGSPWYIFLEPSTIEKTGDVLTKKANIVNGELIRDEAEKFIRAKLGMSTETAKTGLSSTKNIEVCEPEKTITLKKP
jgi:thiol-disulfide isomerase/thioredoxin